MDSSAKSHAEPVTAEAFAAMADLGRAELVEGRVVETAPVGGPHATVAGRLAFLLGLHLASTPGGRVVLELGCVLARDPDEVRAPDVAFIAAERLTDGRVPEGYFEGSPDLVIEILSPGDVVMEMEAKVEAYLTAGARAVWVVNPRARHLTVHTPDGLARILRETEDLATDALPGFRCRVAEIFE